MIPLIKCKHSLIYSLISLLMLDESTLFYWTLRDKKQKHSSVINEWAMAIPGDTKPKPAPQAPSYVTRCTATSSNIPSLTAATSRSSAPSPLSGDVKIVSCRQLDSVKITVEPAPDAMEIYSNSSLSDNNKTKGKEWLAAINSPPKGKKRVTSKVSLLFFVVIMVT
jgi:hypothetical protein